MSFTTLFLCFSFGYFFTAGFLFIIGDLSKDEAMMVLFWPIALVLWVIDLTKRVGDKTIESGTSLFHKHFIDNQTTKLESLMKKQFENEDLSDLKLGINREDKILSSEDMNLHRWSGEKKKL